jgi:hypothetical protein
MTTERGRYLATHPGSPTNGRSSRASGPSQSATRSTSPLPTTSHNDAKSKPMPPLPSTACASLDRQVPTGADDEPAVDTAGNHVDRSPPSHATACPTATPPRPPGRTQWTRERMDIGRRRWTPGRRTPGRSDARTGHWTAVAWTGTRGHCPLAPDTRHRTLAEDTDTVAKHGRHPHLLGHHAKPPRARPPNRAPLTAPAVLGNHDGSAMGPPASARLPLAPPPATRSLRRWPSRASAHCCPQTISGRE